MNYSLELIIEKYRYKRHGSTSYLSLSIFNELINIIKKSMIKIIVKEVQGSRCFSISVNSIPDITHADQLCITLRPILPSFLAERFCGFCVSQKSHCIENG